MLVTQFYMSYKTRTRNININININAFNVYDPTSYHRQLPLLIGLLIFFVELLLRLIDFAIEFLEERKNL